jgi:hypothetical protein
MAARTISRAQMERAIREGGSVLYGGRVISRAEQLPSEAELAQGDPDAEAEAQANLQAQMAALQAQMERLQASSTGPVAGSAGKAAKAGDGGKAKES